jgi:biotin carboxyl carrier protein
VRVDGRELAAMVRGGADGAVDLRVEGRAYRVYVARSGDERWAFVAGRTVRLRRRDPDLEAVDDAVAAGPNLVADMPGKVVKLLVEVGASVAAGQPVIILESMKMETEFAAPVDGVVVKIHVEPGQVVAQAAPLLDIDPAS